MNRPPMFLFSSCFVTPLVVATAALVTSCTNSDLPPGIFIRSKGKTHVHAKISELRIEDYPALGRIHALHTVYYDGGATDAKLLALSQLQFTNLVCVVLTGCPLVTDQGIEHLSQIPTLHSLGLRQMAITDSACDTMANQMRLRELSLPHCAKVTANGLLKLAQSPTMESLGFSVGKLSQDDLLRVIHAAAPSLVRMEIEMIATAEKRLDLAALRDEAAAKKITLFAVRDRQAKKL